MGPNSRELISTTLLSLVDELRMQRGLLRRVHERLGTSADALEEVKALVGSTVASHEKVLRAVTELDVRVYNLEQPDNAAE